MGACAWDGICGGVAGTSWAPWAQSDEEANLSYMQFLLWRHGTRSHKCPTVASSIMNSQSCPLSSHAFVCVTEFNLKSILLE